MHSAKKLGIRRWTRRRVIAAVTACAAGVAVALLAACEVRIFADIGPDHIVATIRFAPDGRNLTFCANGTAGGRPIVIYCDDEGHPAFWAFENDPNDMHRVRRYEPNPGTRSTLVERGPIESPVGGGPAVALAGGPGRATGDPADVIRLPNGNVVLLNLGKDGSDWELLRGVGHRFDVDLTGTAEELLERYNVADFQNGDSRDHIPAFFEFDPLEVLGWLNGNGRPATVHGGLPINSERRGPDVFDYFIGAETRMVYSEDPDAPAFGFHEFEGALVPALRYARDLGVQHARGETEGMSWEFFLDGDRGRLTIEGTVFEIPLD